MRWYEDEEYWKICEGAEELQKYWEQIGVISGDWVLTKDTREPFLVTDACIINNLRLRNGERGIDAIKSKSDLIWLPTQEDLQEMVFKDSKHAINGQVNIFANQFCLDTYRVHRGINSTATYFFDSWVKLWLALIMHELYQKKWNPETKKWEAEK